MTNLLEYIPVSTEEDVPRFIKFFQGQIDQGEIDEHVKKFKATKKSVKAIKTELSQEQSKQKLSDLAAAIQGKQKSREDDFASMLAKYGGRGALSLEDGKRSREKDKVGNKGVKKTKKSDK